MVEKEPQLSLVAGPELELELEVTGDELLATLCRGQASISSVASLHLNPAVVLYLLMSILGGRGGVGWSYVFFVVMLTGERCSRCRKI